MRRKVLTPLTSCLVLVATTSALALRAVAFREGDDKRDDVSSQDSRPSARFTRTFDVSSFLRGNLHTHTLLSDGNSSPERTIAWYVAHGYQFLALTDHNVHSSPARYAALQEPRFVLISGEEITMSAGRRPVHVNALCTKARIPGGAFATVSTALSFGISAVRAQGGVAIVNHPNFAWALSFADVVDARDAQLLEIASGHPYVNTDGDTARPSHEELWDQALSAGANYMGVAVDDVHRIDASGDPLALPGKAWVEVFGDEVSEKAICNALARGDLYSSTGVELKRITVTSSRYTVELSEGDQSVQFIGAGGQELSNVAVLSSNTFSYVLNGGEGYVRVRVDAPRGKHAWTPAVAVVVD